MLHVFKMFAGVYIYEHVYVQCAKVSEALQIEIHDVQRFVFM